MSAPQESALSLEMTENKKKKKRKGKETKATLTSKPEKCTLKDLNAAVPRGLHVHVLYCVYTLYTTHKRVAYSRTGSKS